MIPINRSESPIIPCEQALQDARERVIRAAPPLLFTLQVIPEGFVSKINEEAKQVLERCQNDKTVWSASPDKMRRIEHVESEANGMLEVAKEGINVSHWQWRRKP